jgi:uncharacterized membrane protein (UPF0127 family)
MPRWLAAAIVVALVAAAGCGGGDGGGATTTAPPSPGSSATVATTAEPPATVAPDAVLPVGFERVVVQVVDDAGVEREWCFFLADTPAQRQRGLMEVTSLGDAAGMLFRFGADSSGAFYMYRTLLPLTISWYGADGGFVSTTDMAPCESDDPGACPLYSPDGPYRDALEVLQGTAPEVGAVPGSRIAVTDRAC